MRIVGLRAFWSAVRFAVGACVVLFLPIFASVRKRQGEAKESKEEGSDEDRRLARLLVGGAARRRRLRRVGSPRT